MGACGRLPRRWRPIPPSWSRTWKQASPSASTRNRPSTSISTANSSPPSRLVSPRNKDRADAKETYSNRYLGYLRLGVHLMLVDVLPRPKGFSFSDAITGGLGLELPPLPPPFAAAYRVGEVVPVGDDMGSLVGLWRRPLRVGQPLPALPLPLSVHRAILIDLEETYQRAAKRAYLD